MRSLPQKGEYQAMFSGTENSFEAALRLHQNGLPAAKPSSRWIVQRAL
jgi:hypothetical protein